MWKQLLSPTYFLVRNFPPKYWFLLQNFPPWNWWHDNIFNFFFFFFQQWCVHKWWQVTAHWIIIATFIWHLQFYATSSMMWLFFFQTYQTTSFPLLFSVAFSTQIIIFRSELQTPSFALSLTSSLSIISLTLHKPLLWLCMAFGYFSYAGGEGKSALAKELSGNLDLSRVGEALENGNVRMTCSSTKMIESESSGKFDATSCRKWC